MDKMIHELATKQYFMGWRLWLRVLPQALFILGVVTTAGAIAYDYQELLAERRIHDDYLAFIGFFTAILGVSNMVFRRHLLVYWLGILIGVVLAGLYVKVLVNIHFGRGWEQALMLWFVIATPLLGVLWWSMNLWRGNARRVRAYRGLANKTAVESKVQSIRADRASSFWGWIATVVLIGLLVVGALVGVAVFWNEIVGLVQVLVVIALIGFFLVGAALGTNRSSDRETEKTSLEKWSERKTEEHMAGMKKAERLREMMEKEQAYRESGSYYDRNERDRAKSRYYNS